MSFLGKLFSKPAVEIISKQEGLAGSNAVQTAAGYVVTPYGKTVAKVGSKEQRRNRICLRSAGKPYYAAALRRSGADKFFGFDASHIAVMSASHLGDPIHQQASRTIIEKINNKFQELYPNRSSRENPWVSISDLRNESNESKVADEDKLGQGCSGQHAGMLAMTSYLEYLRQNPKELQKNRDQINITAAFKDGVPDKPARNDTSGMREAIRQAIGGYHKWKVDATNNIDERNDLHRYNLNFYRRITGDNEAGLAQDGCESGALTTSLKKAALGVARFQSSEGLASKDDADALRHVFESMVKNPELVHGKGDFDTEVLALGNKEAAGGEASGITDGYFSKHGYSGVHSFGRYWADPATSADDGGVKKRFAVGAVIKVSDAGQGAAWLVAADALHQLGVPTDSFDNNYDTLPEGRKAGAQGVAAQDIAAAGVAEDREHTKWRHGRNINPNHSAPFTLALRVYTPGKNLLSSTSVPPNTWISGSKAAQKILAKSLGASRPPQGRNVGR